MPQSFRFVGFDERSRACSCAGQVNITRFAFERNLKATNPEYLGEESGYLPPDPTLQGPTNYADAHTANQFHCVGATLEMTIKVRT